MVKDVGKDVSKYQHQHWVCKGALFVIMQLMNFDFEESDIYSQP